MGMPVPLIPGGVPEPLIAAKTYVTVPLFLRRSRSVDRLLSRKAAKSFRIRPAHEVHDEGSMAMVKRRQSSSRSGMHRA